MSLTPGDLHVNSTDSLVQNREIIKALGLPHLPVKMEWGQQALVGYPPRDDLLREAIEAIEDLKRQIGSSLTHPSTTPAPGAVPANGTSRQTLGSSPVAEAATQDHAIRSPSQGISEGTRTGQGPELKKPKTTSEPKITQGKGNPKKQKTASEPKITQGKGNPKKQKTASEPKITQGKGNPKKQKTTAGDDGMAKAKKAPHAYNLFMAEQHPKIQSEYPEATRRDRFGLLADRWSEAKKNPEVIARYNKLAQTKKAEMEKNKTPRTTNDIQDTEKEPSGKKVPSGVGVQVPGAGQLADQLASLADRKDAFTDAIALNDRESAMRIIGENSANSEILDAALATAQIWEGDEEKTELVREVKEKIKRIRNKKDNGK